MKPIFWMLVVVVAALSGAGGWFVARRGPIQIGAAEGGAADSATYTCSMHPQVRQRGPGSCPFCGMALAPLTSVASPDLPAGAVMLSTNRINAIHVQTIEVRRQPLRRTLRVAGVVDDNDSRHRLLSAYVGGRIDALHVNYVGAEVEAGQPLASIYSPALLGAEREYVALTRISNANGAQAGERERLMAGARQRLVQMGLSAAQIDALPDKAPDVLVTDLVAPISGTVVNRMAYAGAYVMEGEKLFEIADFSTMWFRFDAYESDLAWLQPGQTVEVTVPSVPGRTFSAPIAFIDPNLNDPTRSAKIRVELPNPLLKTNGTTRRLLLHRVYAEGSVHLESPQVTCVPRTAVIAPGRPYVFVDRGGGVYEQRRVSLGRAGDDDWEVLGGLTTGERVVTTGNLLIDAQAQLDFGMTEEADAGPGPGPSSSSNDGKAYPVLSPRDRELATIGLKAAGGVSDALARDDLAAFNTRAAQLAEPLSAVMLALTNGAWLAVSEALRPGLALPSASDLKAARASFHPVSLAAAELALAMRRHDGGAPVRVYQCPMVKQSFPGAPKVGRWVQETAGARNPYFGADMLDCGEEVKP